MHPYGEVPFVRIVIPFAAGILIYAIWQFHFPLPIVPGIVLVTIILQWQWQKSSSTLFRKNYWLGVGLNASLFLAGNQTAFYKADINHPDQFNQAEKKFGYLILTLLEPPIEKDNSFKACAHVNFLSDGITLKKVCGYGIVYLQKDSFTRLLHYGDEIIVKNNFNEIPSPKNPDEFNYKRYLWYQEIYSSAYLKSEDWKPMHRNEAHWFFNVSFWLRDHCRQAFEEFIKDPREESVMEALVVGYRDNMSQEIQQAYASAGVIHVLAVSGLHVGILYLVLERLLFFMRKRKQLRRMQSFIIVLVIWLFAFVTGLSGSVVRAAMMFSLIALGKNWNLTANPFNIIASSALIILLWNPLLIMDVGFQLSYAAVISISAFVSHMNWWMVRETKFGDFLWKTTSMSLAAQLGTLPLTTFYFHQFPTLFLLANIIVIPVSGVLLVGGIVLALVQWWKPVAIVIAFLLEKVEWLMNEFIVRLSNISFSVIKVGNFTWWQAAMVLIIIILLVQYFLHHRKSYFFLSLGLFFLLILSGALETFLNQRKKEVTVYAFRNNCLLEFRNGNGSILFCDSAFSSDPWHHKYLQQHHQWEGVCTPEEISWSMKNRDLSVTQTISLWSQNNYFQFQNFRLVVVNERPKKKPPQKRLHVDAILIAQSPKISLAQLLKYYDAPLIILDGSNKMYHVNKWREESAVLGVKCYDVMKEGAWAVNL